MLHSSMACGMCFLLFNFSRWRHHGDLVMKRYCGSLDIFGTCGRCASFTKACLLEESVGFFGIFDGETTRSEFPRKSLALSAFWEGSNQYGWTIILQKTTRIAKHPRTREKGGDWKVNTSLGVSLIV